MRIAIVHDWLTGMRGGEKVLSLLCSLLPGADLLTLIHTGRCDRRIEAMRIITSPLDDLPGVGGYYRHLLPVMPLAIESMPADRYDLIISSSHCVAKGVLARPTAAHVCYCYTPMRYVWAQHDAYRRHLGPAGLALSAARGYLRAWDRRSAGHVDAFIAISHAVAQRIRTAYERTSQVIHPPIDPEFFTPDGGTREDFYLMVTALAPYKRVDQAIDAFARLDRPMRIIGSGQLAGKLRRIAPPNVTLLGWQSDEAVRDHYRRCRALIHPGEEDFGLVPLEAMACGCPVIAYGAGGAAETVLDLAAQNPAGPTGILYGQQTTESLIGAVERFEQSAGAFESDRLSRWAGRFRPERFIDEFVNAVEPVLASKNLPSPFSFVGRAT